MGNPIYQGLEEILELPGVYPHIYGKLATKPYRKMGHVTIVSDKLVDAQEIADQVKNKLKVISATPTP